MVEDVGHPDEWIEPTDNLTIPIEINREPPDIRDLTGPPPPVPNSLNKTTKRTRHRTANDNYEKETNGVEKNWTYGLRKKDASRGAKDHWNT